jgi:CIC family chloride channel protein
MTKNPRNQELGDFTATLRMAPIAGLAVVIGLLAAVVAWALLRLIAFFANLFYFQRLSVANANPAGNTLGYWSILVPVVGAVIIGFMARFGSERIRGHGIPEAIESILMNGSRVEPRVAILKPISSAISIGSGGPFGAEGPIIMTGGAFGSMIAQLFRLTSAERKTLLAAGAAAGMSATFAAPVSAVLLAVELLLFEWKPRSLIPVAVSSAAAGMARHWLLGAGPIFPVAQQPEFAGPLALLGCVLAGFLAGLAASLLTLAVYAAEDSFEHLPIHWMWWPAIGGVVVGLGGLIFPQALGVGYSTIGDILAGRTTIVLIAGVLIVKSIIWSVSLGSGTSGGVLAPLLMIGGALGSIEALFFPAEPIGFWAIVSMGAMIAGAMRAPMAAVIFAVELTHSMNMLLPLLVGCAISYSASVLLMKRSILTEKIARRGLHLSQEYAVDPLELLFVREVMREEDPAALPLDVTAFPDEPLRAVVYRMAEFGRTTIAVVPRGNPKTPIGVLTLQAMLQARTRHMEEERDKERVLRISLPFPRNGGEAGSATDRSRNPVLRSAVPVEAHEEPES